MLRFVLPAAGIVGAMLLMFAGSLGSWSLGERAPPATPETAEQTADAAGSTPAGRQVSPPASLLPNEPDEAPPSVSSAAAPPPAPPAVANAGPAPSPPEAGPAASPPVAATSAVPAPLASPPITPAVADAGPAPSPPEAAPAASPPVAAISPVPTPPASPPTASASSEPTAAQPAPAVPAAALPAAATTTAPAAAPAAAPSASAQASAPDKDGGVNFASVESLVRRLHTPRQGAAPAPPPPPPPAVRETSPTDRLEVARTLLGAGQPDRARPLLEAAAAQLVLRPVDPEGGPPEAGASPAVARVNAALGWLNADNPGYALRFVNAAIAALAQPGPPAALASDQRPAADAPGLGPLW